MGSSKRRTTSSSGGSGKSRKTGISPRKGDSSPTAPPSFVLDGNPPDRALQKLEGILRTAKSRLADLESLATPRVALYRKRHLQKLAQLRRHIQMVTEAIRTEKG